MAGLKAGAARSGGPADAKIKKKPWERNRKGRGSLLVGAGERKGEHRD